MDLMQVNDQIGREKRIEKSILIDAVWKAGFRDPDWVRKDPDLAILHGEPEFERLYPASGEASP